MREIKYRCWDKIDNLLLDCVEINFHKKWVALVYNNGEGGELQQRKFEDIEFMQFTGLLDRLGKEIYEGDIRVGKYYFQEEAKRGVEVMTWHEKEGYWYWKNVSPSYIPDFIEVEVIGNIYENPELVQSK